MILQLRLGAGVCGNEKVQSNFLLKKFSKILICLYKKFMTTFLKKND